MFANHISKLFISQQLLFYICILLFINVEATQIEEIPVAYKGRFRPAEAYARLWLYDIYHAEKILPKDRLAFSNDSALDLLWQMHTKGHAPWDDAPLFWVENKEIKQLLSLDSAQHRFSYRQLFHAIYENEQTNLRLMRPLLLYYFLKQNRPHSTKRELTELSSGLWVAMDKSKIIVLAYPETPPWNFLKPGFVLSDQLESSQKHKITAEAALTLMANLKQISDMQKVSPIEATLHSTLDQLHAKGYPPTEIAQILERVLPLSKRLAQAENVLKVLPGARSDGEWFPLKALEASIYDAHSDKLVPVPNFTAYSDAQFEELRHAYLASDKEKLAALLQADYVKLADTQYKAANGKALFYPSVQQLSAESAYYRYPWIPVTIALYAIALVTLFFSRRVSLIFLITAFAIHTITLALRCYILQRPPVSNMFETIIYVPWITVCLGFCFFAKHRFALAASAFIPLILLLLLQFTDLNNGLENPQAVLDSQYWLTVHVLLVVGSYGAFLLCGMLGHLYLALRAFWHRENTLIAKSILQTMYIGVSMLIPGTILGGIWAAQSWGRFWDWDPKESWAFISICTYLIWIHAWRFQHIHYYGLAVGSIIGFQIITFTWYGVNYILGTGLHSYGFGSGGEGYYYLFLFGEALFLGVVWYRIRSLQLKKESCTYHATLKK